MLSLLPTASVLVDHSVLLDDKNLGILRLLLLLNLQPKSNSTRVSVGLYLGGYHSLCLSISVFTTQDFRIKEKNRPNLFISTKHFSF
jgi:hypothetical protein